MNLTEGNSYMKKKALLFLIILVIISLSFSSCDLFHEHTFGEWQYDDSGHFRKCSCGYTITEISSKHIDEDRNEKCDICRYIMKYEINTLRDLSWYLLYYYDLNQYEYWNENNMKPHSIHEMNFKNTLTYNESKARVKFQATYFDEYLTTLPQYEEYIKSNTDYYSYHKNSGYIQVDIPASYYLFETQETIRYGSSEQHCDYQRFAYIDSKFQTVNEFYDTTSSLDLTKTIYEGSAAYNEYTLSYKNDITNSVAGEISYFIRYYLNVEMTDHGELILPEDSYFNCIDIKTENDIVYFSIAKNDGKNFFEDDIRYTINGLINLKTHNLSYNIKKSYYFNGELMSYVDYDYDLTLSNDSINFEFDFNGDFEEIYIETP